jgi:PIN domain nuclease of toxin-antitoxin system
VDLLLDTHTFLWFVWGDPQLSLTARSLIDDEGNRKFVSMASLWEIAIKVNIGKMTLAKPFPEFVSERLDGNGFETLTITRTHVAQIVSLPFHHRDPFDRLIIAQSLAENMLIVGVDAVFDPYGVRRLW